MPGTTDIQTFTFEAFGLNRRASALSPHGSYHGSYHAHAGHSPMMMFVKCVQSIAQMAEASPSALIGYRARTAYPALSALSKLGKQQAAATSAAATAFIHVQWPAGNFERLRYGRATRESSDHPHRVG